MPHRTLPSVSTPNTGMLANATTITSGDDLPGTSKYGYASITINMNASSGSERFRNQRIGSVSKSMSRRWRVL